MRSRALVVLLGLSLGVVNVSAPAGAQTADGTITGTVTSPEGEPLDEVCVEAFGDDGYGVAETVSDGSYDIRGLQPGSYTVGFNTCGEQVPGYAPEFFDDAMIIEDAQPVTVGAGETRADVDAALALTGTLSGTVLDADSGEELAGICVEAFSSDAGGFGRGVTDGEGGYLVADLPEGSYTVLFVDCSDQVYITEYYDDVQVEQGEPVSEPTPVQVTSGEDTPGIDAGLVEGGAVSGTVLGLHTGEGQPLVCAALFEEDAQDGDLPVAAGFTGISPLPEGGAVAPGEYTIGGVVPGEYVVAYNAAVCEDDGYLTTFYDGAATREDATVISVTRGQVTSEIDAVVVPVPSISFACPGEISPEQRQFDDVPEGNVHAVAIECLALFDIVLGRSQSSYNPAQPVNRAQLASFVARTLEASGVALPADPPNAFDDDNGSVHEPRIDQLAALGIVRGVADRRYAPAQTVNRGQMATFLVNAYERATGMTLQSAGDRFADDEASVHEEAINKAATAGITAGTGSGYNPGGVVQRDQMASFLARLLDRIQRDLLLTGPQAGGGGEPSGVTSSSTRREPAGLDALRARTLSPLQRLAEQAAAGR